MTGIDKDVPIPDRAVFNTGSRFPFLGEMEAGDSFFVEIPDDVEWQIEEYDGSEWIAEKHRIWR